MSQTKGETHIYENTIQTQTHAYISTVLFSESRKENKNFEAVVGITPNYFPLYFLLLQSLFLNTTPK
jgi:hypothetical protein